MVIRLDEFFRKLTASQPCVYTTPFPYWHAMGLPKDTPEEVLTEQAILGIENLLQQQTAPEDTAAIFLEPVIGEGGYIPAPTAYVKHLRKLCDKYGIMLVIGEYTKKWVCKKLTRSKDEIQTGFGRTGKTFAIEHTGVTPDIMVYAKGFANGMPISGIVTRKEIMDVMAPGSLVSHRPFLFLYGLTDFWYRGALTQVTWSHVLLLSPLLDTCVLMISLATSKLDPSSFSRASARSRKTRPTVAG